jgi:hypothetical protein
MADLQLAAARFERHRTIDPNWARFREERRLGDKLTIGKMFDSRHKDVGHAKRPGTLEPKILQQKIFNQCVGHR